MPVLATPEGTAAHVRRHPSAEGHWRDALGLHVSSLGLGSYLGEESDEADRAYAEAFAIGLRGGVNVLDTAANYRGGRSERAVGAAIRDAGVPREAFVVVTKGGFVPVSTASDAPPSEQFRRAYVDTGVVLPGELVAGCHVLSGRYVAHELDKSLRALGLDAVDLYLLHNPETQIENGVPTALFEERLLDAFRVLETARRDGRIGAYGLATWNGLRRPPGHPGHLNLARILDLARRAAGDARDHGFRAIELPYNLAMPEAAATPTQPWRDGRLVPVLDAARDAGLMVLGSATLLQGRLLRRIPPEIRHVLDATEGGDDVLACIQMSRSTPGMTTALVGTGTPAHAEQCLRIRHVAARPDAAQRLLHPG